MVSYENTSEISNTALVAVGLHEDGFFSYEHGSIQSGWNRLHTLMKQCHSEQRFLALHKGKTPHRNVKQFFPEEAMIWKEKQLLNCFSVRSGLEEKLQNQEIGSVLVVGHNRIGCVQSSILGARRAGFEVIVCPELLFTQPRGMGYWGPLSEFRELMQRHSVTILENTDDAITLFTEQQRTLSLGQQDQSHPTNAQVSAAA